MTAFFLDLRHAGRLLVRSISVTTLAALTLAIEDRVYTVVGVMRAGFQFPATTDLWVPTELDRENASRTSQNFQVVGRLAPGVTIGHASAGVRIALGATPGHVRHIVLRQGLLTTTAGIGIGLVAALALSRTLSSLLFDIRPTDPATFAGVAAMLVAIGAVARYIPARRATEVDPIETLRQD